MQVAFTKEDVVDPLKLHGSTILWLEEDRILDFDTSDVGADRDDCGPRQAATYLRGRRNHDAAARAALPVLSAFPHPDAVMQQLDGYRAVQSWPRVRHQRGGARLFLSRGQRPRRPKILMVTNPTTTAPTMATRSGRMPPYSSVNHPLAAPSARCPSAPGSASAFRLAKDANSSSRAAATCVRSSTSSDGGACVVSAMRVSSNGR